MRIRPRKRMFLSLLLGVGLIIALTLAFLWWFPSVGYERVFPGLTVIMAVVFGLVLLLFSAGVALVVLTILTGREMPGAGRLRGAIIHWFLAPITLLGRLVGIPKDDIRRSFIEINNELVRGSLHGPVSRILILMPHCVQRDTCPYRITTDVANCRRCGKCDFALLTPLAKKLGLTMTVATGGTLARRVVIESRPDAIVAVACERDLSAGIVDAYPIPVFGVLLDRPEGPCFNTRVALSRVVEALRIFLPEEELVRAGLPPKGH